jgi:hypothetical protein
VAAAIAQAGDGDTVHVMPGTYAEPPLTISHAVRIEGEAGTVVTTATGDPSKPVFTVAHDGVAITTLAAANAAGGGAVVLSQAMDRPTRPSSRSIRRRRAAPPRSRAV